MGVVCEGHTMDEADPAPTNSRHGIIVSIELLNPVRMVPVAVRAVPPHLRAVLMRCLGA